MKINIRFFLSYLTNFFVEWEVFQADFTVSPCILYHKVLFVPTYALVFKYTKIA